MKITNKNLDAGKYVILSYDHENEAFKDELELYDREGLRYWYDKEAMEFGTEGYDEQFYNALDHDNCVGIVFFLSERFFLSTPCINELKYFKQEHVQKDTGKAHIFVAPDDFYFDRDDIFDRLYDYAEENIDKFPKFKDMKNREKTLLLNDRIESIWSLSNDGKSLYGILGNSNNYIRKTWFIKKGALARHKSDSLDTASSQKKLISTEYGFFPQNEERDELPDIERDKASRYLDKKNAFYAPVEWFVITEDDSSITLLSKKLLFAVEYLDMKFPLKKNGKSVSEEIRDIIDRYFLVSEREEYGEVIDVRFVTKDELDSLLKCCSSEEQKKDMLTPESTFFSQALTNENSPKFWLAGDIEDARRVDVGLEGLSELKPGVETYYVRVVVVAETTGER